MKFALKNFLFLILTVLLFPVSVCAEYADDDIIGKSIYERGLDVVSLLDEMFENDAYIAMHTTSPELKKIASEIKRGDYATPKAVYRVKISDDKLALISAETIDAMSEELKKFTLSKALASVPSRINALCGAYTLAVASVFSAEKTFVSYGSEQNGLYLYTYENAAPIMIAFTAKDDGAVSANGGFILYDGFKTDSVEDIEVFFNNLFNQSRKSPASLGGGSLLAIR